MSRLIVPIAGAFLMLSGCGALVITPGTVIDTPDKSDRSFAGKWEEYDSAFPELESGNEPMTISGPDESGTYNVVIPKSPVDESNKDLRLRFVASDLEDGTGYALLEINAPDLNMSSKRFCAYALVKDDYLFVRAIDRAKVIKVIEKHGLPIQCERASLGSLTTQLVGEKQDIIKLVRNHATEITDEPGIARRAKLAAE